MWVTCVGACPFLLSKTTAALRAIQLELRKHKKRLRDEITGHMRSHEMDDATIPDTAFIFVIKFGHGCSGIYVKGSMLRAVMSMADETSVQRTVVMVRQRADSG